MSKKLRIFQTGVQLSEIGAKHQDKVLSVMVYDQYVNHITDDAIAPGPEFIVHLLFIQDSEVCQHDFEGVESVEIFAQQPLPSA